MQRFECEAKEGEVSNAQIVGHNYIKIEWTFATGV